MLNLPAEDAVAKASNNVTMPSLPPVVATSVQQPTIPLASDVKVLFPHRMYKSVRDSMLGMTTHLFIENEIWKDNDIVEMPDGTLYLIGDKNPLLAAKWKNYFNTQGNISKKSYTPDAITATVEAPEKTSSSQVVVVNTITPSKDDKPINLKESVTPRLNSFDALRRLRRVSISTPQYKADGDHINVTTSTMSTIQQHKSTIKRRNEDRSDRYHSSRRSRSRSPRGSSRYRSRSRSRSRSPSSRSRSDRYDDEEEDAVQTRYKTTVNESSLNLTAEETSELVSFIRHGATLRHQHLKEAMNTSKAPVGRVITATSMFIHGTQSARPSATDKDELTYYEFNIPGTSFKSKVKVPRLAKLDDVPVWQQGVNDALHQIYLAAKMQTNNNPISGLTENEAVLYLLELCDPHLLLMRSAKKQLETEEFDGVSIDDIPNGEIFEALQRRGLGRITKLTKTGMLKLLCENTMREPTFNGYAKGFTPSHNLTQYFNRINALITDNQYTDFDGSSVLVHTFVSGINPVLLRKYCISYLYDQIERKATVQLYAVGGNTTHLVTVKHPRAVYKLLLTLMKETIDTAMATNSKYLENLVVEPFGPPHISAEFAAMVIPPIQPVTKPVLKSKDEKRKFSSDYADRYRNRQRDKSDADKSSTPTPEKKARINKTDIKDKKDAAPRVKKDIATVNCLLCETLGHRARDCPKYKECTCGKPLINPLHDVIRCNKGPLTDAGKAIKAKWK